MRLLSLKNFARITYRNFGFVNKRIKTIGLLNAVQEFKEYTSKYNLILKNNDCYSKNYALINYSFYCHIVHAFPEIKKRDLLNYVPYTITYAVYKKNKIDRDKYTYDKIHFYKTAIEKNISIPFTYGYTEEDGKFVPLMSSKEKLEIDCQHKKVIGKPRKANYGHGVIDEMESIPPNYVFQEKVKDHVAIFNLTKSIHCSTIRVALYNDQGKMNVMAAHFRMNAGALVDHMYTGSLIVDVDIDTGCIASFALDQNGNRFYKHPVSNQDLIGFQLPLWGSILEEAKKVCEAYPILPLIGIDVVITDDNVVILEINGGFQTFGLQFNKKLFNHEAFHKYLKI